MRSNASMAALVFVTVIGCGAPTAFTQTSIPYYKKKTGDLTLLPVDEIPRGAERFTIGGKPALLGDFPASFYQEAADGSCTATLIGPQVLLTAAHCVGNANGVTLKAGALTFTGYCDHHTDWQDGTRDESADFALCLLSTRLEGRKPESVNLTAPPDLKPGRLVLLGGYGCTTVNLEGGDDGVFTMGLAKVTNLPSGLEPKPNDLLTKSDTAKNAPTSICPGDSGGAVFWLRKPNNHKGSRRVIAINSRVGLKQDGTASGVSFLSATFTQAFASFVATWLKQTKAEICGITSTVTVPCRR